MTQEIQRLLPSGLLAANWAASQRAKQRSKPPALMAVLVAGQNCYEIELTRGKKAIIDECDADIVRPFIWHTRFRPNNEYAGTNMYDQDGKHGFLLHRLIMRNMNIPETSKIDHKNGNGLDNRRCNLRAATQALNLGNRRKTANQTTSRFKGVSFKKRDSKWVVWLRSKYIGAFFNETEAARAYDRAALIVFGEFACLNFPVEKSNQPC